MNEARTPEWWRKIEELFHAAADLPPARRADFLAGACGGDSALRSEVEALLRRDQEPGRLDEALRDEAQQLLASSTLAALRPLDLAPPRAPAATLPPGTVLAGKYRLVQVLGKGGMGEVHRAVNVEIDREVAVKILTAHLAHEPEMLMRFRQEARFAARVQHPGIVDVLDLGQDGDGAPFIVMELLDGQTLRERLRSRPALSATEAVAIMAQVLDALAAVHAHRIVHRDLKPENIFLVERPVASVKILDFGISKLRGEGDPALTRTGATLGTPRYMAPEQLQGATDVGPQADLHAVGAMLYEMLAGRPPYDGPTHAVVAVQVLHDEPPELAARVPAAPPALAALVHALLAKTPDRRPGPAAAVREALLVAQDPQASLRDLPLVLPTPTERAPEPSLAAPGRTPPALRRSRWMVAAAVLAVAAALVPGMWPGRRQARRSVAVLGFKNLSGRADAAWLSTALADLLAADLGAGEKLRTISGEDIARMKFELGLGEAETYHPETLQRIRKNLGADYVVLGSYLDHGPQEARRLDLLVRLQNSASGELVASVTESGRESDLFELMSRSGARLREPLGLGQRSAVEAEHLRMSLPAAPEAARLYAEGLGRLRVYDVPAARDLLEKAAGLDPGHPLVHAALSEALLRLGYEVRATEEGKKAFELAPQLTREKRLLVEAHYREAAHSWDRTVEIYRVLWGFFPDELEYGLSLAEAQWHGGKAAEAMGILAELRRLPSPAGEDPRIDLIEAKASWSLSDFKRAASAATGAVRKATAQGARLLAARGRYEACSAYWMLAESRVAKEECEAARTVFEEGGDRLQAASALTIIGNILLDEGDLAAARAKYEEALAVFRALGSRQKEASLLNNSANILMDQGDLAGAIGMYEQALAIHRELGHKESEARTLYNLGRVRFQMGDLPAARALFEESLTIGRAIGEKNRVVADLRAQAGLQRAQGDLLGAKRLYEQARALAAETGNKPQVAEALLGLAQCLLQQGDVAAARSAVQQASDASSGAKMLSLRLTSAIVSARLRAASGQPADVDEALRVLETARADAEKAGRPSEALEARLALGEVEIASGRLDAGRKRLRELAAEAKSRSFGLIARQALAAVPRGRPQRAGASR